MYVTFKFSSTLLNIPRLTGCFIIIIQTYRYNDQNRSLWHWQWPLTIINNKKFEKVNGMIRQRLIL